VAERAFPAAPVAVYGGQRIIASPFQFSTTDDDNLQIVSANSLAGVALTIQGRRLNEKGSIEAFSFLHIPTSDRVSRTENYKIGGGALLNLVVFASSGAPKIGQTYVSARIIRGLSAATIVLGGLLGGYVTAAQPLAYPGSPIQGSIEGGGVIRSIVGTDPAATTEASETVPTGARWQLLSWSIQFATSATPADRLVRLQLDDGTTPYADVPAPAVQAASNTWRYIFAQGISLTSIANAPNLIQAAPLDLPLLAGHRLRTATTTMQAGDNYSAPTFSVREWLEVQS